MIKSFAVCWNHKDQTFYTQFSQKEGYNLLPAWFYCASITEEKCLAACILRQ